MKKIGVVYAPFQVCNVPAEHRNIINNSLVVNDITVIALTVLPTSPTKNNPLDYLSRMNMIMSAYGNDHGLVVVAAPANKYPKATFASLVSAVECAIGNANDVRLYTDLEFAKAVDPSGLFRPDPWEWKFVSTDCGRVMTMREVERLHRKRHQMHLPTASSDPAEMYRLGIIAALGNQYPISWPTVDVAITSDEDGKTHLLLGKKPGELQWRFPGGFKNREDATFEAAALREAGEELLYPGANPSEYFSPPKYVASANIKDWRYENEIDGITTSLYHMKFMGDPQTQIVAGDDIAETKWFEFVVDGKVQNLSGIVEAEHVGLMSSMMSYQDIMLSWEWKPMDSLRSMMKYKSDSAPLTEQLPQVTSTPAWAPHEL